MELVFGLTTNYNLAGFLAGLMKKLFLIRFELAKLVTFQPWTSSY